MNEDMKLYYDYTISPLGKLFYKTVFKQLEEYKNLKVLDFGSGFGFTSSFLARNNDVIALEQDKSMILDNNPPYTQICNDLSYVKSLPEKSFDLVLCHLVLEFVDNRAEILNELVRVLKDDGVLSIVKHNKNGRILQAVVQDIDIKDAHRLLDGGFSYSSIFGDIKFYTEEELLNWIQVKMQVENTKAVRILASLHDAKTQASEHWLEEMFAIEQRLMGFDEYIKIAYFKHMFVRKIT